MCGTDVFLLVLAVLFPPVSVWVKRGICGADSLINIALFCLGYLPGLIHAWYIVLKYPEPEEYESLSQDPEGRHSRVTYYYVSHGQPPRQQQPKYQRQDGQQSQGGYGTLNGTSSHAHSQFPGQQGGAANSFPAPAQQQQQPQPQPQPQTHSAAGPSSGEGSSSQPETAPPSYEAATAGDHKIQSSD